MTAKSVPTLSIGGFLGAGKTTLINHLLHQAEGRRIVVFVNDFGALNIDYDLIETVETDRIALSNGCVCCTLNDDLVQSIAEFCRSDPPDMFMIEASGVADPRALDASLQALRHAGLAHLQTRIYVLDAAQFGGLDYADTEDLVDHAAASDLVVINKSDLTDETRLGQIATLLKRSAPQTRLQTSIFGQLSFEAIASAGHKTREDDQDAHIGLAKKVRFETFSYAGFPPLSQAQFDILAQALQSMCLRAKGTIRLHDTPHPLQLQLVGERLDLHPLKDPTQTDTRLVTIGWPNRIDTTILNEILNATPLAVKAAHHNAATAAE